MSLRFPFDANIARAATIPARLYVDPVYLELERDRIFGRTWQLAARTEQLARTGDFAAVDPRGSDLVLSYQVGPPPRGNQRGVCGGLWELPVGNSA